MRYSNITEEEKKQILKQYKKPELGLVKEQGYDYDDDGSGFMTIRTYVDLNKLVADYPRIKLLKIEGDDSVDLSPLCRLKHLQILNMTHAPNAQIPECIENYEVRTVSIEPLLIYR